jgi:hypothetical protein
MESIESREEPCRVIPPALMEAETSLLRNIESKFQLKQTQQYLERLVAKKDPSVVKIQGGRFEVYLRSSTKSCTTAADSLLTRDERRLVLKYAEKQAIEDERLQGYKFDNFSFLISYGQCPPQPPHVDLLFPNWQCLLALSDNATATLYWEPNQPVRSVQDLRTQWRDLPISLADTMQRNLKARTLIESYGLVFSELGETRNEQLSLPVGSLVSLPGGVVHAGPSSDSFRLVVFFSASPIDTPIPEYTPDIQFFSCNFWGYLVQVLWDMVADSDRVYLLEKLARIIDEKQTYVKDVASHFAKGPLHNFIYRIERYKTRYSNPEARNEYIQYCISKGSMSSFSHWECVRDPETTDLGLKTTVVYREPNGSTWTWFVEEDRWEGGDAEEEGGGPPAIEDQNSESHHCKGVKAGRKRARKA